jgi:hypothetical protein
MPTPKKVSQGKRRARVSIDLGKGKTVEEEHTVQGARLIFGGEDGVELQVRSARQLVGDDRPARPAPTQSFSEAEMAAAYVQALDGMGVTITEQQAIDMHADACTTLISLP